MPSFTQRILRAYYVPSTVLGAGDTAVKKNDEVLASRSLWSKWRERDNIKSGCNMLFYALERKSMAGV